MSRRDPFQRWLHLTVGLGVLTFFLADGKPLMGLGALGLAAMGTVLTGGADGRAVPRWILTILAAAAVFWAFRSSVRNPEEFVSAVGAVFAWFVVLKFYDRIGPRDEGQMLVLSVFSVIAALLTSNSMAVGLAIAVFTPLAVWTTLLFQVHAGRRRVETALGDAPLPVGAAMNAAASRRMRTVTAWTTAACALVAAIVFVLLPRNFGQDMFGPLAAPSAGSAVGFNDEVVLGRSGEIDESQEVVMDVALTDRAGARNLGSADRRLLLRGATLDTYDETRQTWRATAQPSAQGLAVTPQSPLQVAAAYASASDDLMLLKVTIRSKQSDYLFTVFRPLEIRADRDIRAVTRDERDLTIRSPTQRGGRLTYSVLIQPDYLPAPREIGREQKRMPPLFREGKVRELAERVLASANLSRQPDAWHDERDLEICRAFERYLRSNFQYEAYQHLPEDKEEPIEMFLFRTKRGHCEYFASAMAAMCRSIGIDARVVTGYSVSDYNDLAAAYTVKQGDAHAWVEAQVRPSHWMSFDPSPPSEVAATRARARGPLARLRDAYDAVEQIWVSKIVGFDSRSRSGVMGDAGWIGRALGDASDTLQGLSPGQAWSRLGRAAMTGVAAFGATAAAGYAALAMLRRAREARRRAARNASGSQWLSPTQAEQIRFYAALLARLRDIGAPKPGWRPPLMHAQAMASLEGAGARASGPAARLAEAYYRVRFGGATLTEPEMAEVSALLGEVERAGSDESADAKAR